MLPHPLSHSVESRPGLWVFTFPTQHGPYGSIELRRVSADQVRYRVQLGDDLLGWATTLEVACDRLWDAYIEKNAKARHGPPNGRY